MKSKEYLIEYCKRQVGKPYWYGTFGQKATPNLLDQKRKQYPKFYKANDFPSQFGQRVHDCVGLIKGALWSDTPDSVPMYVISQDVSAKGMYLACAEHGTTDNMPMISGCLVFKGSSVANIHHVGVYSNGHVYEAKGHAYGVVKGVFKPEKWDFWGLCPWIDYGERNDEHPKPPEVHTEIYVVRKGDNLTKISRMFGVPLERLIKLNNIENPDLIFPNQILKLNEVIR